MLSPAQLAARDGRLTASRVSCLMSGRASKLTNLWRKLIGDPSFVPDDLSDVWPVQLGSATEELNLDWFGASMDLSAGAAKSSCTHVTGRRAR